MVAASKLASASRSRACRAATSSAVPLDEVAEKAGVVAPPVGVGQCPLGLEQLGAHALAQFLAGRAAEGDQQHLVEPGAPSATYRVTRPARA